MTVESKSWRGACAIEGFHVIYAGLWQSSEAVVKAVADEDADWLGLSLLSGCAHDAGAASPGAFKAGRPFGMWAFWWAGSFRRRMLADC